MSDHKNKGAQAGLAQKFFLQIRSKLDVPTAEILVHLMVTVFSVLSIALIELLLHIVRLDGRKVPGTYVTLSDWMFLLEVIAATLIISVGVVKAVVAAWRAP
jgi:hypothetical protein